MAKRRIFGWFRKHVAAALNRSVRHATTAMPSTIEKRGPGDHVERPRDSGHEDGTDLGRSSNLGGSGYREEHRPPHESHPPNGSWNSASSRTYDVNDLSEDLLNFQIGSPPPDESPTGPAVEHHYIADHSSSPFVVPPYISVPVPTPGVPELVLNVRTKRCRCPPGTKKGARKSSRKPQRTYTSRGLDDLGECVYTSSPQPGIVKFRPAPQLIGARPRPEKPLLLACPFLKHDPETYEQRNSCRGKAYHDIHRLKEHLYRVHKQKVHCVRCGEFFPSEADVKKHLIRDEGLCELVKGVSVEGMDAAQEKELKSKKRKRHVKTEQDKWKEIYRILFPTSAEIPDPYYKSQADAVAKDGGPASMDQSDVESIFAKDIPRDLEEETFCKVESISGPLGSEQRRKMLSIFKGFVTKRLKLLKETQTVSDGGPDAATARSCPDKPKSVITSPQALSQTSREQLGGLGVNGFTTSLDPNDVVASTAVPIATLSAKTNHKPLDLETLGFNGDSDVSYWPMWNNALVGGNMESHDWVNGAGVDPSVQVLQSELSNGTCALEDNSAHGIPYDDSFFGGPHFMNGDFMADASTNRFPPPMPWPAATGELPLEQQAVDEPREPRV